MSIYQEIYGALSIDTNLTLTNNYLFQIAILTISSISLTSFNHYIICLKSFKLQLPFKYNESMDSNTYKKWIEKIH